MRPGSPVISTSRGRPREASRSSLDAAQVPRSRRRTPRCALAAYHAARTRAAPRPRALLPEKTSLDSSDWDVSTPTVVTPRGPPDPRRKRVGVESKSSGRGTTMIRKFWRRVSWPIVFTGAHLAPFTKSSTAGPSGSQVPACPGAARTCRSEEIIVRLPGELQAQAPVAMDQGGRRRGDGDEGAGRQDRRPAAHRAGLAKDLGDANAYKSGTADACKAAAGARGRQVNSGRTPRSSST